MPGPIEAAGAVKNPSKYGALAMGARQFTGLWTQRSPYRDAAVPYLVSKFYSGSRFDSIIDGINREISQRMTDVRRPGNPIYNSQTFAPILSFYPWKYIQNGGEVIRVMVDTAGNVYDGTGPSTKLNIWNKNVGSGPTRFLGVNTELFFNDGIEPKKWVESSLIWEANTLFDGAATSDTPLGDFIIDPNGNIQQAVGGFTLLVAQNTTTGTPAVSITDDILTLTLDTSQLSDPSDVPTGVAATTGGTLPAGNNYARIAAVDPTGNVTEAGTESAAVVTTGTTSQIAWIWPAVAGAVSYRIYVGTTSGGETTYFTSSTNSFTQTLPGSNVPGTPPTTNSTSVDVPENLYSMVGVELALSEFTSSTFLNGQTITIASVLPGGQNSLQITAPFTHADYTSAADTGIATSGSGITGSTQPSWATTLWAVTQDGGAQWINRGSYIENWGIATPATAPTIFPTKATSIYPAWQVNTTYWRSGFITQGVDYYLLTTSGMTGTSVPTFDNSSIGATTTDGTAVWTYEGTLVWASGTAYAKGAYTTFVTMSSEVYIYQAQNSGTSGSSQTGWAFGAGTLVSDGGIVWLCLGIPAGYNSITGQFTPSRNISNATIILDSNGYLQQIQDGSIWTSGFSTPTWGAQGATTAETLTASITAFEVLGGPGGLANVFADNVFPQFPIGNVVNFTISGMTVGTYLNGTFPLEMLTNTELTIDPVPFAAISMTSDSGTATYVENGMWLNTGPFAPLATAPTFYAYSYGNSVTGHVGTASEESAPVNLLGGYLANLQGFGSADSQVDTIWLWATAAGESTLIFMDKIANPGGGVQFTYQRTIPDTSLNPLIAAPVAEANDPPPTNITAPAYHLNRIFAIVNNTVVYSGGPDTLVGSGNESFAPLDSIPYVAQPYKLVPVTVQNGGLLVYTSSGIQIILGTGTPSNPFYTTTYYGSVNVIGYDAVDVFNNAVFCMESNGKVSTQAFEYPFNPQTGYTEVGFPIGDQFQKVTTAGFNASLFNPATSYVSWNMNSSGDTGMYVADGAGHWFRLSIVPQPETGMLWNPLASIEGGTSAVQSVETVPGTHLLLIGPGTSGPILMRDITGEIFEDNGAPYPGWDAKGVNILCSTGQWAEVVHVSAKSTAVGARPIVSVLMNEIRPSLERPYRVLKLDDKSDDPARTPRSVSVFSDRYLLKQSGANTLGDCLLTKFDYGTQAVADELLDWGIYARVHEEREEEVAPQK